MKRALVSVLIAAAFAAAAPATAQSRYHDPGQGNVRLLGVTRLSPVENDVDVIPVQCRPRVAAIKLRARNAPAEIEHVALTYANGQRQHLPVRDFLARGEETPWIDLRGGRRCVVEIALVGDTERRGRYMGYGDDDRRDGRRYYADYDDDRGWRENRRPWRQARIQVFGRSW